MLYRSLCTEDGQMYAETCLLQKAFLFVLKKLMILVLLRNYGHKIPQCSEKTEALWNRIQSDPDAQFLYGPIFSFSKTISQQDNFMKCYRFLICYIRYSSLALLHCSKLTRRDFIHEWTFTRDESLVFVVLLLFKIYVTVSQICAWRQIKCKIRQIKLPTFQIGISIKANIWFSETNITLETLP